MSAFFNIFARSPFAGLVKHMHEVTACVEQLEPFMAAVLKQDWSHADEHHQKINQYEHEADLLKQSLRSQFQKKLYLALSRSDILALVSAQDAIANQAKTVAGLIQGRQMIIPEAIASPLSLLTQHGIEACRHMNKAIEELEDFVASGFSGEGKTSLEKLLDEVDRLETESNTVLKEIRSALFAIEKDLPPVDVICLYQAMSMLGAIADAAEHAGNQLLILLSR